MACLSHLGCAQRECPLYARLKDVSHLTLLLQLDGLLHMLEVHVNACHILAQRAWLTTAVLFTCVRLESHGSIRVSHGRLDCCCRWSELLTPGPACLRTSIAKGIRHTLWANHMWLKQKKSHGQTNDSDEDDTEQFGIREGVGDEADPAAADEEDEEEVLPLFGDDESDFGSSSSEVNLLLGSLPRRIIMSHVS